MTPGARALVLVVDDDPLIRNLVFAVLEDARFDLAEATDGEEALRVAAERPPDVVILDVMMPGMDGNAVCKAMRADARLAGARIIMLTARSESFDRDQAMEAGADDFISKPFSPLDLIAAVTSSDRSR